MTVPSRQKTIVFFASEQPSSAVLAGPAVAIKVGALHGANLVIVVVSEFLFTPAHPHGRPASPRIGREQRGTKKKRNKTNYGENSMCVCVCVCVHVDIVCSIASKQRRAHPRAVRHHWYILSKHESSIYRRGTVSGKGHSSGSPPGHPSSHVGRGMATPSSWNRFRLALFRAAGGPRRGFGAALPQGLAWFGLIPGRRPGLFNRLCRSLSLRLLTTSAAVPSPTCPLSSFLGVGNNKINTHQRSFLSCSEVDPCSLLYTMHHAEGVVRKQNNFR